jgi:hypothetical protein
LSENGQSIGWPVDNETMLQWSNVSALLEEIKSSDSSLAEYRSGLALHCGHPADQMTA